MIVARFHVTTRPPNCRKPELTPPNARSQIATAGYWLLLRVFDSTFALMRHETNLKVTHVWNKKISSLYLLQELFIFIIKVAAFISRVVNNANCFERRFYCKKFSNNRWDFNFCAMDKKTAFQHPWKCFTIGLQWNFYYRFQADLIFIIYFPRKS